MISLRIKPAVLATALALSAAALAPLPVLASSHMDAPLITLDDPANMTDVYSFVATRDGTKYLVTALAVYPFEEPGVGPNAYRFLATVLGIQEDRRTNRTDLAGIFIPDLIKTDLSTVPARLAGGAGSGAAPDDQGFHRLSIFGGDVLTSTVQQGFGNGTIPGGWPNGRRFGDDVIDIGVLALLSDLRTSPPVVFDPDGPTGPLTSADADVDRVNANDIGYNKVFPYAATPLNGRNHPHHGDQNTPVTRAAQ